MVAGDINGDGLPDIVVGNKRGTFVHLHQKKTGHAGGVGEGAAETVDGYRVTLKSTVCVVRVAFLARRSETFSSST